MRTFMRSRILPFASGLLLVMLGAFIPEVYAQDDQTGVPPEIIDEQYKKLPALSDVIIMRSQDASSDETAFLLWNVVNDGDTNTSCEITFDHQTTFPLSEPDGQDGNKLITKFTLPLSEIVNTVQETESLPLSIEFCIRVKEDIVDENGNVIGERDDISEQRMSLTIVEPEISVSLNDANNPELEWTGIPEQIRDNAGNLVDVSTAIFRSEQNGLLEILDTVLSSNSPFEDDLVTPGLTYAYEVEAQAADSMSRRSNNVSIEVPDLPGSPILNPPVVINNDVILSWSNVPDGWSVQVLRGDSGGELVEVALVETGIEEYTDMDLEPGIYEYALRATNDVETTEVSNTETVVVPPPEDLPPTPELDPITVIGDRVSVSWSEVPSGWSTLIYRGPSDAELVLLDTVEPGSSTYLDASVEEGTEYFYAVQADSAQVRSTLSNIESITIPDDLPATPPVLDELLAVENDAVLSWSNVPVGWSTRILRRQGEESLTEIATVGEGVLTYLDPDRSPGAYEYAVQAFDGVVSTDTSNTLEITIPANPTPPPVLEEPFVVVDDVNLSWSNIPADWETRILKGDSPESLEVDTTVFAGLLDYIDPDQSPGTYYYAVQARNGLMLTDTSNVAVVNVPFVLPSPPELDDLFVIGDDVTVTWSGVPEGWSTRILIEDVDGSFSELATVASGVVEYLDADREPGTYTYALQAVQGQVLTDTSNVESITVPPVDPTDPVPTPVLTMPEIVGGAVSLTWSEVLSDWSTLIYRGASEDELDLLTAVGPGTSMYEDVSIEAGVEYFYAVQADSAQVRSTLSNIESIIVPGDLPATPPVLDELIVIENDAVLSWSNVPEGWSTRILRRQGEESLTEIATVGEGVLTYVDPDRAPGTYEYAVQAFDGSVSTDTSNALEITIPSEPIPPPVLEEPVVVVDDVDLAWSNVPVDWETRILKGESPESLEVDTTVIAGLQAYVDQDQSPGTFYYAVQARNGSLLTDTSNVVVVTIPEEVPSPPVLDDVFVIGDDVTLTWSGIVEGWSTKILFEEADGVFSELITLDPGIVEYLDADRAPGTYTYALQAVQGQVLSDTSNVESVTVPLIDPNDPVPTPVLSPLEIVDGAISLTWAEVFPEWSTLIYRGTSESELDLLTAVGPGISTFQDVSIVAGVEYFYAVQGDSAQVRSNRSNIESIKVSEDLPEAPILDEVVVVENDVVLTWSNVPEEWSTRILRRQGEEALAVIDTVDAGLFEYINIDAPPGTYVYAVQSFNNEQFSAISNEIEITVPGPPLPEAPDLADPFVVVDDVALEWSNVPVDWETRILKGETLESLDVDTTVAVGVVDYVDKDQAPGTYYYAVQARNGAMLTDTSNVVSVVIPVELPTTPVLETASVAGDDVTLIWSGVPDTWFTRILIKETDGEFSELAKVDPGIQEYVDMDLAPGSYTYAVQAESGPLRSAISNEKNVVVLDPSDQPDPPVLDTLLIVGQDVRVEWSGVPEGWRSQVLRGDSADTLDALITVESGVHVFVDTTVDAGASYYYAVLAQSGERVTDTSAVKLITLPENFVSTPDLLELEAREGDVTLTWSDVQQDNTILLRGRTENTLVRLDTTVGPGILNFVDKGLDPGTYYYAVQAAQGGVLSDTSKVGSVDVSYSPIILSVLVEAGCKADVELTSIPLRVRAEIRDRDSDVLPDSVLFKWRNAEGMIAFEKMSFKETDTLEGGDLVVEIYDLEVDSIFADGATIEHWVEVYDTKGNSAKSGEESYTQEACQALLLGAQCDAADVVLTWQGVNETLLPEFSYTLWRANEEGEETQVFENLVFEDASDLSYTDSPSPFGLDYTYRVAASDGSQSLMSNSVTQRCFPVTVNTSYSPIIPLSQDEVLVTAALVGELDSVATVELEWAINGTIDSSTVMDEVNLNVLSGAALGFTEAKFKTLIQASDLKGFQGGIPARNFQDVVQYWVEPFDAKNRSLSERATQQYTVQNSPPGCIVSSIIQETVFVNTVPELGLGAYFFDPDPQDVLSFALDPVPGLDVQEGLNPVIDGDMLLLNPVKADTSFLVTINADDGTNRSGAFGTSCSFEFTIVKPPVILELEVSAEEVAEAGTPQTVTIDILEAINRNPTVAGAFLVDELVLFYRRGGEEAFQTVILDQAPADASELTDVTFTIPGDYVGDQGVELRVEANFVSGEVLEWPSDAYVSSIRVAVVDEAVVTPRRWSKEEYTLLSVPLELRQTRPGSIFEDDLGGYGNSFWYFWGASRKPGGSLELAEFPDLTRIEPGRGYWVYTTVDSLGFDVGDGVSYSTTEPFEIPLEPGWSLIGNPFTFGIPLENVSLKSSDTKRIQAYDLGWSSPESLTSIRPFAGYAAFVASSEGDTLVIDPLVFGREDILTEVDSTAEIAWTINISAESKGVVSKGTRAQVAGNALDSWDAFDWPSPPSIGSFVSVSFLHDESTSPVKRYQIDVRPESEDGHIWDVQVQGNTGAPVLLTFEGMNQVPADQEIWLIDTATGISQDLREYSEYRLGGITEGSSRTLQMLVGSADFREATIKEHDALPAETALQQNFPNPFNPTTTVPFTLTESSVVTLEVYDILGKRVTTLVAGEEKSAGRYNVIWDGRNDAGQTVASGLYFFRFRAGAFVQVRKTMMVK